MVSTDEARFRRGKKKQKNKDVNGRAVIQIREREIEIVK